MLYDHSWTVQTPATLKIMIASSPSRLIAEGVNSLYNRTPRPTAPPRALCAFETYRTVWSGFPSLTTMLGSHCQPWGGRGALGYAISPHSTSSYAIKDNFRKIFYLIIIIKRVCCVACGSVWRTAKSCRKIPVFPIYSERSIKSFCPVRNRQNRLQLFSSLAERYTRWTFGDLWIPV